MAREANACRRSSQAKILAVMKFGLCVSGAVKVANAPRCQLDRFQVAAPYRIGFRRCNYFLGIIVEAVRADFWQVWRTTQRIQTPQMNVAGALDKNPTRTTPPTNILLPGKMGSSRTQHPSSPSRLTWSRGSTLCALTVFTASPPGVRPPMHLPRRPSGAGWKNL